MPTEIQTLRGRMGHWRLRARKAAERAAWWVREADRAWDEHAAVRNWRRAGNDYLMAHLFLELVEQERAAIKALATKDGAA